MRIAFRGGMTDAKGFLPCTLKIKCNLSGMKGIVYDTTGSTGGGVCAAV